MAYHRERGTAPTTDLSPELEMELRELLGDKAMANILENIGKRTT